MRDLRKTYGNLYVLIKEEEENKKKTSHKKNTQSDIAEQN